MKQGYPVLAFMQMVVTAVLVAAHAGTDYVIFGSAVLIVIVIIGTPDE